MKSVRTPDMGSIIERPCQVYRRQSRSDVVKHEDDAQGDAQCGEVQVTEIGIEATVCESPQRVSLLVQGTLLSGSSTHESLEAHG